MEVKRLDPLQRSRLEAVIYVLFKCKLPTLENATFLLEAGTAVLKSEPNVLRLHTPITVCGDIHGQFFDLLELFSIGGKPPEQNFLFLGDYVDRGFYSTETWFLLLALKARYPTKIYLLRGNHESQTITEEYGFKEEIIRKFHGEKGIYDMCIEAFNALPLAAVIDNKIFCVHGGLSGKSKKIIDIDTIDRFQEPPDDTLFSDLLWSDPKEGDGYVESTRGAGILFGRDITIDFLNTNGLSFMLRAHQLAFEGYTEFFDKKLYTVWSAPNYCYREGNVASILEITKPDQMKFKIFTEAPTSARVSLPEAQVPEYFD